MVRYFALLMRFVVIGLIYIILFRIIKIIYLDMNSKKEEKIDVQALEVTDAPDNLGIAKGHVYPVSGEMKIGRKTDNDIVIDDPFISSHHAVVSKSGEKLLLKDLKSTNGTYVNDIPLDGEREIDEGDRILIGRIHFKVI